MVFSSHIFVFYFLLLAVGAYFATPSRTGKHIVLTLFSYAFYGWWNPWFVFLMLGSTAIDYCCGKMITADGAGDRRRKLGVTISVISNLSILGFFKYFTFAIGSVSAFAQMLGMGTVALPAFFYNIVLPVGISFYTFQSMSYSIDLYRGHAKPAPDFLSFACYVSMFPQLVAGPIVRYGSVAQQIRKRVHTVEGFTYGLVRFNLGFRQEDPAGQPDGRHRGHLFPGGRGLARHPGGVARRLRVRVPDLLRFLRVF